LHDTQSSRLLALHYEPHSPRQMLEAHLAWAAHHTSKITPHVQHGNDTNPDRPLRIGYLSPDFRQHSVARFIDAPLRAHDRGQFQIYLYSDVQVPDDVTADFALSGAATTLDAVTVTATGQSERKREAHCGRLVGAHREGQGNSPRAAAQIVPPSTTREFLPDGRLPAATMGRRKACRCGSVPRSRSEVAERRYGRTLHARQHARDR